ncbi:MAG TPA: NRDE family protein [Steroidobacteraceae bacterium]|nr:NRDE family protein [Steroidobacteraceae bacterium]HQW08668.1 NRDE family protein [Steroidobacteraceae bacterium]HQX46011.1 NRDE family protein [Steroidobacteraceae bacterium]HQX77813.1 NRDE family protein [Steroidobacteraceae bacterium]HQZ79875.1 NRDE family protein [Steroidobacteraceae bacterium]
MCLVVLAWNAHPRYRLIVAANRDEFHNRPAAALAPWREPPLLAGRDLEAGGTWLGVDRGRRFGVVTNYREMMRRPADAPSRGALITDWLSRGQDTARFSTALAASAPRFAGFNLLIGDRDSLHYASNRADGFARALSPGVYGLANHILDTPWPKVLRVRRGLEQWLAAPDPDPRALFTLLADRTPAKGADLPETGLSPEWEQALSAPFVAQGGYGTRCSTVLAISHDDSLQIDEHRFDADGKLAGVASFRLAPGEWPGV